MPIEKVRLDPFDIDSSIAPPKPSTAKPRVQSSYGRYEPKPRKKVEYDNRTELDYIQDALSKKTVSEREADFNKPHTFQEGCSRPFHKLDFKRRVNTSFQV